jgi:hypothetical protein
VIKVVDNVEPFDTVKMKPLLTMTSFLGKSVFSIELEPVCDDDRKKLKQFRDQVSEVTKFRSQNHDSYQFHITLAYILDHMTPDEKAEIGQFALQAQEDLSQNFGTWSTGPPKLTFFKDMLEFVTVDEIAKVRE